MGTKPEARWQDHNVPRANEIQCQASQPLHMARTLKMKQGRYADFSLVRQSRSLVLETLKVSPSPLPSPRPRY